MKLRYAPPDGLRQAIAATGPDPVRRQLVADLSRINTLYSVMRAGSGHLGSSFSAMDIVTWVLDARVTQPANGDAVYFSSKGHDAPGLYTVMAAYGLLDFDLVHALRRIDGLPGHPDVGTPGIVTNTGSLGMGISKAKGLIRARRQSGTTGTVYVLTGDGELQEGQIWESLGGAATADMRELVVIVDANQIQSDTWVEDVSPLGDLIDKFEAFGWMALTCDGHDFASIDAAMTEAERHSGPSVVVARTVKGRGVQMMEGIPVGETMYRFHSGAPSMNDYETALAELGERCTALAKELDVEYALIEVDLPDRSAPAGQSLIDAYSRALVDAAAADATVVVLDADLVKDTGTYATATRFPDRFIECGIAEQDMVSQAGALAIGGLRPVVHSFACFLTTRANEQIFNNATEHTKVMYTATLAGLIPAGPGHSHQSVRDVSLMASVPGMTVAEATHPSELAPLLHLLMYEVPGPAYLRLVSVPVDLPFDVAPEAVDVGRGYVVRDGADVALLTAGPVTAAQAAAAVDDLAAAGVSVQLVICPWLNATDPSWLRDTVGDRPLVIIDNHAPHGGLAQHIVGILSASGAPNPTAAIAVHGVAVCGTNDEALRHHGLDSPSIAATARRLIDATGSS